MGTLTVAMLHCIDVDHVTMRGQRLYCWSECPDETYVTKFASDRESLSCVSLPYPITDPQTAEAVSLDINICMGPGC